MKWTSVPNTFTSYSVSKKEKSKDMLDKFIENPLGAFKDVKDNLFSLDKFNTKAISIFAIILSLSLILSPLISTLLIPVFFGIILRKNMQQASIQNLIEGALNPRHENYHKAAVSQKASYYLYVTDPECTEQDDSIIWTIKTSLPFDNYNNLETTDMFLSDIKLLATKLENFANSSEEVVFNGPLEWAYEDEILYLRRPFVKHDHSTPLIGLQHSKDIPKIENMTWPVLSNQYQERLNVLKINLPKKYERTLLRLANATSIIEGLPKELQTDALKKVDVQFENFEKILQKNLDNNHKMSLLSALTDLDLINERPLKVYNTDEIKSIVHPNKKES